MRSLLSTVALATSIIGVSALNLVERTDGSAPKVVQHKFRRASPEEHRQIQERDSTVTASLTNTDKVYYLIDVEVGTPPQTQKVHIDTGSSDLWVNTPSSKLCSESSQPCANGGTYTANDSSTYQYANSKFNISYVDGTGSVGDYAADKVTIGGVTLNEQIFGIGYSSSNAQGVLGISYPQIEAIVKEGYKPYANVPANLVQSNKINSNAYSLYLDDLDARTGSILFGGVDHTQYNGELATIPIIPQDGAYQQFIVALTAVGTSGNTKNIATGAQGVLLDSGTSLIYLPDDVTKAIYSEVGAQYDASQGGAFVDCSLAQNDATIDFTFSSPTVKVAMSELVFPNSGGSSCQFGIMPAGNGPLLLGDTFLRSAYVVYDLENHQISLAQSDFSQSGTNIQEISASQGVPGAKTIKNAVSTVPGSGEAVSAASSVEVLGCKLALVAAAAVAILAL